LSANRCIPLHLLVSQLYIIGTIAEIIVNPYFLKIMTSNQRFRQILLFIVGVTLSCTSLISIANKHAFALTGELALVKSEISFKQQARVVQVQRNYDELRVSHTPVVYVNSPVAFMIESPQPISKLILYVDDVYAGGVNVNGSDTKMEMLFTSPGIKELKFIGIREEGGTVFSHTESIRVVSTESSIRQENSNYDPAIVYKPLSERKRIKEESSDSYNSANSSNNSGNSYRNGGFSTNNSFLNTIIQNVQEHVQQNGILIPAHIIVAMAALESGYGKSTLARNANNLFGLKACNGNPNSPDIYVYVKYPAEDCNLYRKFDGTAACVNFFINELLLHKTGKWQRDYSPIVRRYQDEINQGFDKVTATEHFIEGLVNKGYTTAPLEEYKYKVMSLINTYQLLKME
jgi:flagellum-specific peptidoglycan hydrolase FlgJ